MPRQRPITVVVHDKMQRGYRYRLTARPGREFDPRFQPGLAPRALLALGVFGGKYMTDCRDEFPRAWFIHARLCAERHEPGLNCFGVNASQSLAEWRRKGWIRAQDPRGWFQWYCRYYLGRRSPDDDRQIRRWLAIRRHLAQLQRHCSPGDLACRRRQRQALLHWAYDTTAV